MNNKTIKICRGQSILEVLIALAAILLVITAIVRGIVVSVKSSNYSKLTAQAANLAQEGMENMRIYRDASWLTFWGKVPGTYDLSDIAPNGPCPTDPNLSGTPFIRCVALSQDGTKAQVVVTVSWTDSAGSHKSELRTFFTDWK